MQGLAIAIRATVIVLGIAALATLANRLLGESSLQHWLLMRQQSLPGALWLASAAQHLGYGLFALVAACLVARGYLRALFPEQVSIGLLAVCFAVGVVFAMFLNHPMHELLFETYFGKPQFTGGAVSDALASSIFSGIEGYGRLLTFSGFATIILSPVVEELTDRGIFFKEADGLPLWLVALISIFVFSLSHFAIGGMAKVLAVVPAAMLFVAIRLKTGSFVYAAAAHVGVNLAALLKLQVF